MGWQPDGEHAAIGLSGEGQGGGTNRGDEGKLVDRSGVEEMD